MNNKIIISIYGRADIEAEKENLSRDIDILKKDIEKQLEKINVFLGEIEIEEVKEL